MLIDILYKISIELVDYGPHMVFKKDPSSKLTWICSLNYKQHPTIEDVRLSVVQFLSELMVCELDLLDGVLAREMTEKIRCRLFNVLQNLLPDVEVSDE